MRTWMALILGVVVAAVVITLLVSMQDRPAPFTEAPVNEQPVVARQPTTVSAVTHEVPVQLTAQFFAPAEVTVAEGDTVVLIITSVDADHAVYVGDTILAPQGIPVTLEFTPQGAGDHSISCTEKCMAGVSFTVHVQ